MREKSTKNDLIWILLLYLAPILSWIFYSHAIASFSFSWLIASIGFVILFLGSSLLYTLMQRPILIESSPEIAPEVIINEPIALPPHLEDHSKIYLEQIETIQNELHDKTDALLAKNEECSRLELETHAMQERLQEILEASALKEEDLCKKIEALEIELNQKGQTSKQLENQIYDLRYEIKTLLQLTEMDYSQESSFQKEPLSIEEELEPILKPIIKESSKNLLTRCVDVAQKMTAGYHATTAASLSSDPYAFDLRRLSDALRQETKALIVLYSPKEERVLFANGETKIILGLSPEEFSQDFTECLGEGFSIWKNGVMQLLTKPEVNFKLDIETRMREMICLQAHLASIPTGVFRSLVIGVLEPI